MPLEHPQFVRFRRDIPKDAAVADILERTAEITGLIITLAAVTESNIGVIIADHFSTNLEKRNLMVSLLVSRHLSFETKKRIFIHVLNDHPDIMANYPDLEKRLAKLIKFRNRVAHSFPDASDRYLQKNYKDRIRLISYEKGIKKHYDVTFVEAQKQMSEFALTLIAVEDIRQKIGRFPAPDAEQTKSQAKHRNA